MQSNKCLCEKDPLSKDINKELWVNFKYLKVWAPGKLKSFGQLDWLTVLAIRIVNPVAPR
jgi:hypothetical protein